MKAEVANGVLDILGGVVAEVSGYCRQKALYEADCRVRQKLEEARRALYLADSAHCQLTTVELQRSKLRLQRLEQQSARLPSEFAGIYMDLIKEVEARIEVLRESRRRSPCLC